MDQAFGEKNEVIEASVDWWDRQTNRPFDTAPKARALYDCLAAWAAEGGPLPTKRVAQHREEVLQAAIGYANAQKARPDPVMFGQHELRLYDAVKALELKTSTP